MRNVGYTEGVIPAEPRVRLKIIYAESVTHDNRACLGWKDWATVLIV